MWKWCCSTNAGSELSRYVHEQCGAVALMGFGCCSGYAVSVASSVDFQWTAGGQTTFDRVGIFEVQDGAVLSESWPLPSAGP